MRFRNFKYECTVTPSARTSLGEAYDARCLELERTLPDGDVERISMQFCAIGNTEVDARYSLDAQVCRFIVGFAQ